MFARVQDLYDPDTDELVVRIAANAGQGDVELARIPADALAAGDPVVVALGEDVTVDELRTYDGTTYRCIQAHTTQSDWTPDVTPALWEAQ